MQGLKVVVIFMGILIVAGLGLLGYGIMNDWHKKEESDVAQMSSDINAADASAATKGITNLLSQQIASFGDIDIALPKGAEIIDIDMNGGLMVVRYQTLVGQYVKIVNLAAKDNVGKPAVLGTVEFVFE